MSTRIGALALQNGIRQYASFIAGNGTNDDVRHLTGAPVPSTSVNFEYYIFDKSNPFRIPNTQTSRTNPTGITLDYGGSKATGSTIHHKSTTEHPIMALSGGGEYAAVSDGSLLADLRSKVQMAGNQLNLEEFSEVQTVVDAAAGTATIDLTSSSTEAVLLLQAQIKAVLLASGGTGANCKIHLLWGMDAFLYFANHAKVQARVAGGATTKTPSSIALDLADLDRILGLGTVSKLSGSVYESAKPGQASSLAFMLSNTVYIAAVSMTPNDRDPSAVKRFRLGAGDEIITPNYWRHPSGTVEYATWAWEQKPVVTNSGALKKVTMTIA